LLSSFGAFSFALFISACAPGFLVILAPAIDTLVVLSSSRPLVVFGLASSGGIGVQFSFFVF